MVSEEIKMIKSTDKTREESSKKRMNNRASSDKTNSTSEEQVIMDEAGPSLEPWMSRP